MTIKELSRLYLLNKEITADKERLEELENTMRDYGTYVTGLPHVDTIDRLSWEMMNEVRIEIEYKTKKSIIEYSRLNRYISNIDDCLIRQIISLRFVNGLTWREVAQNIGGGNTADSVKKILQRYIRLEN